MPEGRHGARWIRFESELQNYILAKIESKVLVSVGVRSAGLVTAPELGIRKKCNDRNSNPKTSKEIRNSRVRVDSAKLARRERVTERMCWARSQR